MQRKIVSYMHSDRPPVHPHLPSRPEPQVPAAEHLRYIREIMERTSAFTAVPGWGSVWIGVTALGAAWLAARQPTPDGWLAVWLVEAALAATLGTVMLVRKARRNGVPLRSGAGRKYVLSLLPSLAAGAFLTLALWQVDATTHLPGLWLLLYGAGTITGGIFSVRVIPLMGLGFMLLGAIALWLPFGAAQGLLALGFGGLHLLFGWIIVRHYGG